MLGQESMVMYRHAETHPHPNTYTHTNTHIKQKKGGLFILRELRVFFYVNAKVMERVFIMTMMNDSTVVLEEVAKSLQGYGWRS